MNRIVLIATIIVVFVGTLAMCTSKPVEPVKAEPVAERTEADRILDEVLNG